MTQSPSFPAVELDAWWAQVQAEVPGKDAKTLLTRRTEDGVPLPVLSTRADSRSTDTPWGGRGVGGLPWVVDGWTEGGDGAAEDVAGGATGLRLDATGQDLAAVRARLERVDLGSLQVEITTGQATRSLRWLEALAPRLGIVGDGCLAADVAAMVAGPVGWRTLHADGEGWAERGATGVQECAWALAEALTALRRGDEQGVALAESAPRVALTLTCRRELLPSIARLRAVRSLWARALAAWGLEAPPLWIRAVSHPGMLSAVDPWVNLLRTSHGAFAAIVAGADAVQVAPFDAALGAPDALARRVARNTSQVLGLEAHLGRVEDPTAGSWAIEQLTERCAQAIWAECAAVLPDFAGFLASGRLDAAAEASFAERERAVGSRKIAITGVNEYPVAGEERLERSGPHTAAQRDSASWEGLRSEVEDAALPPVCLVTWGRRPEWNARAIWVTNLLQAAGFTVSDGDPQGSIACLCAADARYGEAAERAAELRARGVPHLLLAGRAVEGVDAVALHVGAPVLDRLRAVFAAVEGGAA